MIDRQVGPHAPLGTDLRFFDGNNLPEPTGGQDRGLRVVNHWCKEINRVHSKVRKGKRAVSKFCKVEATRQGAFC